MEVKDLKIGDLVLDHYDNKYGVILNIWEDEENASAIWCSNKEEAIDEYESRCEFDEGDTGSISDFELIQSPYDNNSVTNWKKRIEKCY